MKGQFAICSRIPGGAKSPAASLLTVRTDRSSFASFLPRTPPRESVRRVSALDALPQRIVAGVCRAGDAASPSRAPHRIVRPETAGLRRARSGSAHPPWPFGPSSSLVQSSRAMRRFPERYRWCRHGASRWFPSKRGDPYWSVPGFNARSGIKGPTGMYW